MRTVSRIFAPALSLVCLFLIMYPAAVRAATGPTPPWVTAFSATTPSARIIPITAFTAYDNNAVAGYMITESATPPSASDGGWSASAPNHYTVAADGTHTLYPWAKDLESLVSAAYGSPVTVSVARAGWKIGLYFNHPNASYLSDVQSKLNSTGLFSQIDILNPGVYTPTLEELQEYGAVLIGNEEDFDNKTAFGNVLADYADAGGGVVLAGLTFNTNELDGRLVTGGYLPFMPGGQLNGTDHSLIADLPAHPLLAGVASFAGGTGSYRSNVTLADNATLIAHWNDPGSVPLVGTKQLTDGKVVGLNFYPPSSTVRVDFWTATTDGARLMGNALLWAAHLYVDSTAPTVTAFSAAPIEGLLKISITEFTAADDLEVRGYLITESAIQPDSSDPHWMVAPPKSFTVPANGTYTLYPWVKDDWGNVSPVYASPVTVAVQAQHTARLFGTTSNGDVGDNSTLIELDSITGAFVRTIGSLRHVVNGLDYDPVSGTLFGTTSWIDPNFKYGLLTIDMATGEATRLGSGNPDLAAVGTVRAAPDGTLFAWSGSDGNQLLRINPDNGSAVIVGLCNFSVYAFGASFDAAGDFYLINSDAKIYTIDPATGQGTDTGVRLDNTSTYVHHGDFHPATGQFWGINKTGKGAKNLNVVNVATGEIIASLPTVNNLHTLAFIPRLTPVITWANPADISYGTALGAAQLNATADVDGIFVYTPAAGTVLGVGTHTLHVDFTPTDNGSYIIASKDVTITVTAEGDCIDEDDDSYGDGCSNGADCNDNDFFYYDICPACEVKIAPTALGRIAGTREKTRWVTVTGNDLNRATQVRWESSGITVERIFVLFKRFMFLKLKIDGATLTAGDYRALIGNCAATLTLK